MRNLYLIGLVYLLTLLAVSCSKYDGPLPLITTTTNNNPASSLTGTYSGLLIDSTNMVNTDSPFTSTTVTSYSQQISINAISKDTIECDGLSNGPIHLWFQKSASSKKLYQFFTYYGGPGDMVINYYPATESINMRQAYYVGLATYNYC